MIQRLTAYWEKNEKIFTPTFLILGFLFDIVTLDRIDSWMGIAQQGVYLIVIAVLVALEIFEWAGRILVAPDNYPKLSKIWPYRMMVVHFFLGSLLSSYTIFYFKSASYLNSFIFISILSTLLVANEYSRFQGLGTSLRMALFTLCLLSYLIYFVPILMGYIGQLPFALSVIASAIISLMVYKLIRRRIPEVRLRKQALYPMALVHILFVFLYWARILPPVPLSITYMGIYHNITKIEGKYHAVRTRPRWKFWQHGDQSFAYRPGDQLYGFFSIFSPSGFHDEVYVRWMLYDAKRGWTSQDRIPLKIVGGREKGFRSYMIKKHFTPGNWRFQIETTDEREVGRLYFTVFEDTSTGDPYPYTEVL